jgi:hypothetical protein
LHIESKKNSPTLCAVSLKNRPASWSRPEDCNTAESNKSVETLPSPGLPWRDAENPEEKGSTLWSPFDADTKYFGRGKQGHMINYRVASLKRVLTALKKEGVWIDPKGIQASEYGKFAWIKDGEGNRIELWEPPKGG